jgi:hypothetical protein
MGNDIQGPRKVVEGVRRRYCIVYDTLFRDKKRELGNFEGGETVH